MGVYEIFFKSNGKKVVQEMNAVSRAVNDTLKNSEKMSTVFDDIDKGAYNMSKSMSKASETSQIFDKDLSRMQKTSKKQTKDMSNNYKDMIKDSPFKALSNQSDELNEKMDFLKKMSGVDIGPFKAMTNQFKAMKMAGFSTTQALSGGFKTLLSVGSVTFKGLMVGAKGLMGTLWPLLAVFVAIKVAMFILKKMWQINFLGMQTSFNKVMGKIKTAWAKFNVLIIKGLRKIEPVAKFLFKAFKIYMMPTIITLKVLWVTLKILGKTIGWLIGFAWRLFKVLSPIVWIFKGISWAVKAVIKLFEKFKKTKYFDNMMKPLKFLLGFWDKLKKTISDFMNGLPDWAKNLLGIKEVKMTGSPGAEASNIGNRANSIINDNKNVTIMSNKQVDKQGANGLASIIQEQSYVGDY